MSLYKLYGTGVTDGIASVDIIAKGHITAIQVAMEADLDADLETARMEVSFSSASGFTTNDTKSSIVTARAALAAITAAGTVVVAENFCVTGIAIPVDVGERMYLHGAGTNMTATVYIHVSDRAAPSRRVRA